MGRSLQDELSKRNSMRLKDIDPCDFMEMAEEGLDDEEISRNLNVSPSFVKSLRKELENWHLNVN